MTSTNDTHAKDKALRKHNSLNPHPENVTDELFAESDFFDPRDLAQVKYEMLRHVRKDGWSVVQAARAFGFSRNALYRAQEAFKKNGIAGLMHERPGPRRPHKFTVEVMDFIEEALLKDGALTTVQLCRMIKERFGISVHRRSVERSLTRCQKKGKKLRRN